MRVIHNLDQGTEAWFLARAGKITASRASDLITAAKGELSKSSKKYLCKLIADCISPEDDIPPFDTAATRRGVELEPLARDAFSESTGYPVEQVGLVVAANNVCACSPDGLIPDGDGGYLAGLEIKCPLKDKHVEYVLDRGLPDEYKQQVHFSMVVTGLSEWHFYSWHPRYKAHHAIIQRDEYTDKVESAVGEFVSYYKAALEAAIPMLKLNKN